MKAAKSIWKYEPADLIRILEETRDLFSQQMARKQLAFSVHSSQVEHPYVWCDIG